MRDSILGGTRFLVRVLMALNTVAGVVFAVVILVSVSTTNATLSRLAREYGASAGDVLLVMSLILVVGLLAFALAHRFLHALREILASVAAGDPFIAENGLRLRRMGFVVLAFQIGDFVLAVIDRMSGAHAMWFPSLSGWLTVLLLFVLARVFAVGSAMRDELEATV